MMGLLVFILCVFLLIVGYVVYGRLVERVYGGDPDLEMPCVKNPDGVDYVPLPAWRVFLIQLLNIAGLGPVVGAVSGCLFGPVALLWIVLGCILAGAMHDFLAALMSAERNGQNLPEQVGENLGRVARCVMRFVCIFLLLMVGVVFTLLPAGMLQSIFGGTSVFIWGCVILGYYFLATILPIQALIGRIYPIFGALFLFMAAGMAVMLPLSGYEVLPDLDMLTNVHPKGISVWPMLFVTIACGAISGFHATQSPMMVRCLPQRCNMRRVFYGAMIVEGMVALVWAVVGLSLRDVLLEGDQTMAQLTLANPSAAVYAACRELLGVQGGMLAVLGVVVLAVTSGDTAMRSCRLMLADVVHVSQKSLLKRLALAIPLFGIVIIISQIDFSVIWRYFGWGNQLLSCFTLWSISVCLRKRTRLWLVSALPAVFMTCMCTCFLCHAPECGLNLPLGVATGLGMVLSVICLLAFLCCIRPQTENGQE